MRSVAVVSFSLSAGRWFGLGRVRWFRMVLCSAPRVGVGFGRLRPPRRWFRLSFSFWTALGVGSGRPARRSF